MILLHRFAITMNSNTIVKEIAVEREIDFKESEYK